MPSKWDRIISALVTWIKNISWVSYELIQVTRGDNLDNFESILWYFSHTFHYATDEISRKYKKTCQSGKWMSHPSPSFVCMLLPYHVDYVHHVSYMCAPCASDVGDVCECIYPFHICEVLAVNHMQMRLLSHTWSGWEVLWEVHCLIWLFSQKVWEKCIHTKGNFPWFISHKCWYNWKPSFVMNSSSVFFFILVTLFVFILLFLLHLGLIFCVWIFIYKCMVVLTRWCIVVWIKWLHFIEDIKVIGQGSGPSHIGVKHAH